MRILSVLVVLSACKGPERPTLTAATPAPTPAPTPVSTPAPTPPASYTLPGPHTLLRDIPGTEWPDVCGEIARSQEELTLFCDDFEIEFDAYTQSQAVQACIDTYSDSGTWVDCDATLGDLQFVNNWDIDCHNILSPPAEVEAITECIADLPTEPPTPACETLADLNPPDGSPSVFPDRPISMSLTNVDATLTVTVSDGSPVAGSGSWAGNTYVWTPNAPMTPSQSHTVDISWCNGTMNTVTDFTTSPVGTAVGSSIVGNAYELDLEDPSAIFIQPPGVGSLLQSQLGGVSLLVGIESATSNMDVLLAVGEGLPPTQDLCEETIDSSGSFSDPYFDIPGLSFPLADVQIGPLDLIGGFTPDGSALTAELSGEIDTRDLVPLLAPGGADDAVCVLMGQFGISCITCGTGGDFCLPLQVVNVPGTLLPGQTLVEVDTPCP